MHQAKQFLYQHPLLQQLKNQNALDDFDLFLFYLDDFEISW